MEILSFEFTFSEVIEIIILGLLVAVTIWYAISTSKIHKATVNQANATREAVTVALNAEKSGVMPIIYLKREISGPLGLLDDEWVECRNIGNGPAMNVRIWLSDDPLIKDNVRKWGVYETAVVEVDGTRAVKFKLKESDPPSSETDSGFRIIAEFSDIYGRKFRSETNAGRKFLHESVE